MKRPFLVEVTIRVALPAGSSADAIERASVIATRSVEAWYEQSEDGDSVRYLSTPVLCGAQLVADRTAWLDMPIDTVTHMQSGRMLTHLLARGGGA